MDSRESEVYKSVESTEYSDVVYSTIELVLTNNKQLAQILCGIDNNGVFRDGLLMLLKSVLRPAPRKELEDYVSNLVNMGFLELEIGYTLYSMPVKALKKNKKGELKLPRGSELVEIINVKGEEKALLRMWKALLVPSFALRAVCKAKGFGRISL